MHQVTSSEVTLNSSNKALGGQYVQLAAEHKRQQYHENAAMSLIQLCSWMTPHQKLQRHLYHCGPQLSPSVVTQKATVHTRASGCQKKTYIQDHGFTTYGSKAESNKNKVQSSNTVQLKMHSPLFYTFFMFTELHTYYSHL